ncbi:hypothetical protein ZWY2020_033056 [Hordeum vulgare]|nr:hypothetical protein ZWY2020_033056 [Hordeum vulgare]
MALEGSSAAARTGRRPRRGKRASQWRHGCLPVHSLSPCWRSSSEEHGRGTAVLQSFARRRPVCVAADLPSSVAGPFTGHLRHHGAGNLAAFGAEGGQTARTD